MRISGYIKTLLYRYDCVIIPSFGAFLTKREPAQIHETTDAFYPPKKSVAFNRQITENDGVLANYIAKTEEISYDQSVDKILSFVNNLNESLETHGQVRFDEIGSFYTRGDKILFQPLLHNNYLLEAFGTDTFTSAAIAEEIPSATSQKTAKQSSGPRAENPVINHPEKEVPNERSPLWKYAAVGVLAIGLGGFLTANWYSSKIKSHNIAAQQEAEQQIENRIQQATFVMDNPLPEITFRVTTKRGKYHLVAGAFRKEKNAKKKLAQLKEDGYHAKYIGANKYGLHQVIYDSYEKRREALKELYKIQNTTNSAAWLLVKKL